MGETASSERSISRPNYSPDVGGLNQDPPKGVNQQFQNENKALIDKLNQDYRNENPLLAVADDTIQGVKQLIYLGAFIAVSYVGIEGYKAYKQ